MANRSSTPRCESAPMLHTRAREVFAAPVARSWSAAASRWTSTSRSSSARSTPASCSPASRIPPLRRSSSTSTSDRRSESDDRGQPVRVAVVLSLADGEVEVLELAGQRPGRPRADGALIDLDDRRNLGAGPAEQDLIGDVKLTAVDPALDDLDTELVTRKRHQHRAGDALNDVLRCGRSDQAAAPDDEEILRAPLTDVALLGHEDRLVEPIEKCLGLGERAVDVDARRLGARRRDVVVDAPPARHLAANPS